VQQRLVTGKKSSKTNLHTLHCQKNERIFHNRINITKFPASEAKHKKATHETSVSDLLSRKRFSIQRVWGNNVKKIILLKLLCIFSKGGFPFIHLILPHSSIQQQQQQQRQGSKACACKRMKLLCASKNCRHFVMRLCWSSNAVILILKPIQEVRKAHKATKLKVNVSPGGPLLRQRKTLARTKAD